MSDLDHELLHEKMMAVAGANLVSVPNAMRKGVQVSAVAQKAGLFAILAYEGELLSNNGLASRIGVGDVAATSVIQVLAQQGLIVIRAESRARRRFTVSLRRLLELQSKEPLWERGGTRPRGRFHQAITNRKLRQALEPILTGIVPEAANNPKGTER